MASWPAAPDPPIELVCVLSNHADVIGHRLVCRRLLDGEYRDYHLAINGVTARRLERIFARRPFKRMAKAPREPIGILYLGVADPKVAQIYLMLHFGRSRRKVRLRVPPFVLWELEWVAALEHHEPEYGRPIAQA